MTEDEQKKIFSKNLNYYITQSGKQQKEVAKDLGIQTSTFNTWCVGKIMPRMGKVQMLADYFRIEKTDLTDEHTEKPSYYLNKDAEEMAQFMFDNPEYKVLFDASRKIKKEDIDLVAEFIKRMSDK